MYWRQASRVMDDDKVAVTRARRDNGVSPTQFAKAFRVSRARGYRYLAAG